MQNSNQRRVTTTPRIQFPVCTLAITLLSLSSFLLPNLDKSLEWNRAAISNGEFWRIFTGHITHWTSSHLIWDTLVFVILGLILEKKSRPTFVALLILSPLSAHIALQFYSSFELYRGLSAIDTSLYTLGLYFTISRGHQSQNKTLCAFGYLGLLAMFSKISYELILREPVFADNLGTEIQVATVTHMSGFLTTVLIVIVLVLKKYFFKQDYLDIKILFPNKRDMDNRQNIKGEHLFLLLYKAGKAVETYDNSSIKELGFSNISDFIVLEVLLHKGALPVNTIGQKLMLTSGSVTTAIDRAQKKGFVTRERDIHDGRIVNVALTQKGHDFINERFTDHANNLERLFSVFTKEEKADFARLVKKIGTTAEAYNL